MSFTQRTDWKDDVAGNTPVMAADMLRIEAGIATVNAGFNRRTDWKDDNAGGTPVMAADMLRIEAGIATALPSFSQRTDWKDNATGNTAVMAADMLRIEQGVADAVGSTAPPTGTQYVSYTSLYVTGDSFKTVLGKVPAGKILTLPPGTFTIGSNFADPAGFKAGVVIPANCAGIWGSGRGQTILQLAPNSSTQGSYVAGLKDFDSNQCMLIEANHNNITMKNFQLRGTPQGHSYSGLRMGDGTVSPQTGAVVDGVFFNGCGPGTKNFPPEETTSLESNHTSGLQILNCEVDGRDPVTGVRIGSSGMGINTSTSIVVSNTSTHHSNSGHGIAIWRCSGGTFTNLVSEHNGTGATDPTAGNQVNIEQSDGTFAFTNLTATVDHASGNGGFHLTAYNDDGTHPSGANITISGVTNDGVFSVDYIGAAQSGLHPTITKGGVTLTPVSSGGNAATNYTLAH